MALTLEYEYVSEGRAGILSIVFTSDWLASPTRTVCRLHPCLRRLLQAGIARLVSWQHIVYSRSLLCSYAWPTQLSKKT